MMLLQVLARFLLFGMVFTMGFIIGWGVALAWWRRRDDA
jgi:hypothetical protein